MGGGWAAGGGGGITHFNIQLVTALSALDALRFVKGIICCCFFHHALSVELPALRTGFKGTDDPNFPQVLRVSKSRFFSSSQMWAARLLRTLTGSGSGLPDLGVRGCASRLQSTVWQPVKALDCGGTRGGNVIWLVGKDCSSADSVHILGL